MQNIIIELLNSLGVNKNDKVLDFGCGSAKLVKFINENNFTCYGVDIQQEVIESVKKEFEEASLNPDLLRAIQITRDGYTIKSEDFKLPFEDNFFDYIISFQVFEHIDNLEEVVSELYRIVKPNAQIYLEFPSANVIVEPHLEIPFVHKLNYSKLRELYIEFFAKLKKIKKPHEYAKMQNDYLNTSCFYRPNSEFDKLFESKGFVKIDYAYKRRSLRMKKNKVFTLKDLLLYKLKKHNNQSKLSTFSAGVKLYLRVHAFFYSIFTNRLLVFKKEI